MRKLLFASLVAAAVPSGAWADTIDPLHGECTGCVDNGAFTPLPAGTTAFGFSSSPPGQTGELTLDVLIPNNVNLATFVIPNISGFGAGTPANFSTTAWSSGTLAAYLGETNASPDNPIGAYLPYTQGLPGDTTVTGYYDFRLDVGAVTGAGMSGPGYPDNQDFSLSGNLPIGSYIVAELLQSTIDKKTGLPVFNIVETANSAALLTTNGFTPTPLPATAWLFLPGLFGMIACVRRRRATT
jgi:hypothetical protein